MTFILVLVAALMILQGLVMGGVVAVFSYGLAILAIVAAVGLKNMVRRIDRHGQDR